MIGLIKARLLFNDNMHLNNERELGLLKDTSISSSANDLFKSARSSSYNNLAPVYKQKYVKGINVLKRNNQKVRLKQSFKRRIRKESKVYKEKYDNSSSYQTFDGMSIRFE